VIPKSIKEWSRYQGISTNRLAIKANSNVVLNHIKIRVNIDERDPVTDPNEVVAYIEAGGCITRSADVRRYKIDKDGWRGFEDRLISRQEICVEKGSLEMVAF
jgi:hypothetical protein